MRDLLKRKTLHVSSATFPTPFGVCTVSFPMIASAPANCADSNVRRLCGRYAMSHRRTLGTGDSLGSYVDVDQVASVGRESCIVELAEALGKSVDVHGCALRERGLEVAGEKQVTRLQREPAVRTGTTVFVDPPVAIPFQTGPTRWGVGAS